MNTSTKSSKRYRKAFTLVELLLVISVIAIMGALAISHFSNASQDTRRVVARQQQAALQSAVNAWVAGAISGNVSVEEVRTAYNTKTNSKERLDLIYDPAGDGSNRGYLDDVTYEHFDDYTTDNNKLQTSALLKLGRWLELPLWVSGSYPKVDYP